MQLRLRGCASAAPSDASCCHSVPASCVSSVSSVSGIATLLTLLRSLNFMACPLSALLLHNALSFHCVCQLRTSTLRIPPAAQACTGAWNNWILCS